MIEDNTLYLGIAALVVILFILFIVLGKKGVLRVWCGQKAGVEVDTTTKERPRDPSAKKIKSKYASDVKVRATGEGATIEDVEIEGGTDITIEADAHAPPNSKAD